MVLVQCGAISAPRQVVLPLLMTRGGVFLLALFLLDELQRIGR